MLPIPGPTTRPLQFALRGTDLIAVLPQVNKENWDASCCHLWTLQMEIRMWAAPWTPMGPKAEFEFKPRNLKSQFSYLLTYLYNPANWRAAVISRQTQSHSYFQFSSPVGKILLPPPPLQAWCRLWDNQDGETCFFSPGANTTRDFYLISSLCWTASFPGFPPKRWKGLGAIHNCCFFSATPSLAISLVIQILV